MTLIAVCFMFAAPIRAESLDIPERFFRGIPQPDGSMQLVWTCPASLDPKTVEDDSGWWNACAKIAVLIERDSTFRAAFDAAGKDPALSSTGVTYTEWSRSDQDRKSELRERIQKVVQSVVDNQKLVTLLRTSQVEASLASIRRAQQEQILAKQLGITQPTAATLIKYCPGAAGNVSVNPQHPAFGAFDALMKQPTAAAKYESALAAFGSWLDKNPKASIDERNAELTRLMSPLTAGLIK